MAQITLQKDIIYGPVFSRRLGRSFGINLLPRRYKACSFDCIYCQYGSTHQVTLSPNIDDLPTEEQVLADVEKALMKPRSLDYLTFSGNGEPTIHPQFPSIVKGVKEIRDRLRPNAKLALLSNSSMVMDPQVFKSLQLIDAVMMKLDAGNEQIFQSINRPIEGIHLSTIIEGLKNINGLIIQSIFIDGSVSNVTGENFESWVDTIVDIDPEEIHLYSTERPTAEEDIIRVDGRKLKRIESKLVQQYGLNARAFWTDL